MSENKRLDLYGGVGAVEADLQSSLRNTLEELAGASATTSTSAPEYRMIMNGTGANELVKQRTRKRRITLDLNGNATIETDENGFAMQMKDFSRIAGMRTSTAQLYDALTIAATANGLKSPTVVLTQHEYMEQRGLKDWKSTKEQIAEDLQTLSHTQIRFAYKQNGKERDTAGFINVADSGSVANGTITFTFGATFFGIIKDCYNVMPYHMLLQKISGDCYNIFRKILEHKNMNCGRANENILSVKTLLSVCTEIPPYEEVKRTGRQVRQRIIEPFERNMNALLDALTWHYCHAHGAPLTDDELLVDMSYSTFSRLNILITWNDYPDQTQRLERKAAQIEAAKKRRPRAKKPEAETES